MESRDYIDFHTPVHCPSPPSKEEQYAYGFIDGKQTGFNEGIAYAMSLKGKDNGHA